MSKVGIIANPASGKDIRRLVSHATVISDYEKIDIVKRVILGADSAGVDEIVIMPDFNSLGLRALEGLNHHPLSAKVTFLDFELEGGQEDSLAAAGLMREDRVDCIVTLGGDGTNRIVSKACGRIPLIPLSTGTNNVFPVMNEGTTAGIAAGIFARKILDEDVLVPTKKMTLLAGGRERDVALIDAVVVAEAFIGARALWDMQKVEKIFLTRAEPGAIGFSSLGAALHPVGMKDPFGLMIELGPGGEKVRAPIAPGLIKDVDVKSFRVISLEERIPLPLSSSIVALDGEREVEMRATESIELALRMDGPRVASIERILAEAAKKGFFRR